MLIGSDLKDRSAARREVDGWITRHHCHVPKNARHLSVFENGVLIREWVLVEGRPEVPVLTQGSPLSPGPDIVLVRPGASA
jgi:hypothetical protein